MSTEIEHNQDWIISICSRLNNKNMLAAGDGNISIKLESGDILITAKSKNKGYLTREDFAIVNQTGKIIEGEPSTELAMHLQVYDSCKQAKAVVHAHPPTVIGFSIANPNAREIPTDALPEVILGVGSLPIAPYGRPGTQDLANSVGQLLKYHYRAIVMARHGALAWGESLIEAYNGIERMEHAALVLAQASMFGEPVAMEKVELEWLQQQFKNRGGANL